MPRFIRTGGIVELKLSPPLEFIDAQHGRFRQELEDFSGLWARFARTMASIEQERFATEGHGEWPPLAPSTLIAKEREGFPWFPLIRTGRLYESLTEAELAMRMDPQSMSWGTDVPYAQYHQEGGRRIVTQRRDIIEQHDGKGYAYSRDVTFQAEGHPPQRKVLDLTVGDRRRLERDMVDWLNDVARQAFGAAAV